MIGRRPGSIRLGAAIQPGSATTYDHQGAGLTIAMIGGLVAVLLSPVVWTWGLQDYQRSRWTVFLDPITAQVVAYMPLDPF